MSSVRLAAQVLCSARNVPLRAPCGLNSGGNHAKLKAALRRLVNPERNRTVNPQIKRLGQMDLQEFARVISRSGLSSEGSAIPVATVALLHSPIVVAQPATAESITDVDAYAVYAEVLPKTGATETLPIRQETERAVP